MSTVAELQRVSSKDLTTRITALETELEDLRERVPENKVSIILLSGDFDKAMATLGRLARRHRRFSHAPEVAPEGRRLRGEQPVVEGGAPAPEPPPLPGGRVPYG